MNAALTSYAEFTWSNDDWAATWLPWVRAAVVMVNHDEDPLTDFMKSAIADGETPNFLEGLTRTKRHLDALSKLLEAALTRSCLILERLGYTPDNPPPDNRVN